MVLYCYLEFFKAVISEADIAIGTSFTCPVTNFLGNYEVLIVVLYCSFEFFKAVISMAEIGTGVALTYPVTNFLAMMRC